MGKQTKSQVHREPSGSPKHKKAKQPGLGRQSSRARNEKESEEDVEEKLEKMNELFVNPRKIMKSDK